MEKKSNKPMSFTELVALGLDGLVDLAKTHVKLGERLADTRQKFTSQHVPMGKAMAALKVVYAEKQDAGHLPKGTSFRDWHNNVTGENPNNHVEACAATYNNLVVPGLITEMDYDCCPADWLEKACTIVKECKNDLTHAAVSRAADVLKRRDVKTGAKELREIISELKGKVTDENGKAVDMTTGVVVDVLRKAFAMGFHGIIMAEIIAEVHHASVRPPEMQRTLFLGGFDMGDAWAKSGVDEGTLECWANESDLERQKRQQGVQIKTSPSTPGVPAETPAPAPAETPAPVAEPIAA